jgi:Putative transposase DNA-binding domain
VSSVFECAWVCSSRCLVKPQLGYKTARFGGELTVADRWFPSSQIHHGHTNPDGTSCRLIGRGHIDKQLVCPLTGEVVDRDRNAALNLRLSCPNLALLDVRGEPPAVCRVRVFHWRPRLSLHRPREGASK